MLRCGTCDRSGCTACLRARFDLNDNRDAGRACLWEEEHRCFPLGRALWLLWRFALFAVFFAGFVGSVIGAGPTWITYLTKYSYVFVVLTSAFLLAQTIVFVFFSERRPHVMAPVTTALYAIAAPSSVVVTILYFALLNPRFTFYTYVPLFEHLLNSVLLVVDLLLSGVRLHPCGFFWTVAYFLLYLTYALVYQAVSGVTIYPGFTDLSNPGILVPLLLLTPILLALVYFVLMVLADVVRMTRDEDEERLFSCGACCCCGSPSSALAHEGSTEQLHVDSTSWQVEMDAMNEEMIMDDLE